MKLIPRPNNITLLAITIIALAMGTYTTANYLFPPVDDASKALTYGSSANVSFTFDSKLSMALSMDDLAIGDMVPGTTEDSNSITVAVSSNTPYGYTLSARVGSNDEQSVYYNTSDLVHANNNIAANTSNVESQVPINNRFTSIATNASEETLTTDNTWGYSTSADGGNNWSAYSGLSSSINKTILDTNNPAASSTIDFKVAARSAATQASGVYSNSITFYAVGKPKPLPSLYNEVARQNKGTQTAADLQSNITIDNSGVYEYSGNTFGESSDAADTHKIYYYRGILDDSFASSDEYGDIGSSGDGALYPNYVILDADGTKDTNDTCWRIVRTTGSGGVKMIYNGLWTGSTCANSGTDAQASRSEFNGGIYTYHQIVRAGYTYNSEYAKDVTYTDTIANVFGSNDNPSINDSDSTIKIYLENTFYPAHLSKYTDILEPSAGYCNDRSIYNDISPFDLQSESMNVATYVNTHEDLPTFNFGARIRNFFTLTNNGGRTITLSCPRGTVDLYTTTAAANGNKQMSKPVALLTADEVAFAGSGTVDRMQGSANNRKSFLRSGEYSWLLSPRAMNGVVWTLYSDDSGDIGRYFTVGEYWVRPVVSLAPYVGYSLGSGTAADPWVVTAP